nr:PAS domain S-box protein [Chloroflexota bacterium]
VQATFGYSPQELLGEPITLLMAEDLREPHRSGIRRYIETGDRSISWEGIAIRGRHRDGHEIPMEVSFGEAVREGRRIFTGIVRDVSERHQAQEALRRSQEQLQQSQRMEAIGRLAGGIAHDFNNLLTAITGYSDLLLSDLTPGHPMRDDISEIKRTADRAAVLTRQLLAFSRRQVLEPRVLDLNRVVADMEPMLQRLIGEDVTLVSLLDPRLRRVKADPGQLEQVVMNLAVNSRDAMPSGGLLTIETSNVEMDEQDAMEHLDLAPGRYVMLAVSDSGMGMDSETQSHLFEPFYTTKEQGKGTGLGLATVYGIVTQSGGTIWVYSELARGTTFKIYMPDAADVTETYEPVEQPAAPLGGSETILLTEDDPAVRALAHQVLLRKGYNVIEAPAPSQAILVAERFTGRIHLLLTDVVMPEMGGPELARRLISRRPEMKVLFMSGYTEDAIVHHGVLNSGVEFLQKPFSPDMLARRVRAVLDTEWVTPLAVVDETAASESDVRP